MKRYFSFTDTERVVLVGKFDCISDALDEAPSNSVWVFEEASLIDLSHEINDALNEGRHIWQGS